MPGVITCGLGEGDGDAVGICIPGVITCGLGDGEGLGLVVLLVVVRLARVVGLFLAATFGFGFGFAAGGFGMTWPSCCGNAWPLTAKINANTPSVCSPFLKLTRQIMIPLLCNSRIGKL